MRRELKLIDFLLFTLNVVTTKLNTKFHMITVLSSAPDAKNSPFGEKLTQFTAPVCSSNDCVICGTFNCQIWIDRPDAMAENCESLDISKQEAGCDALMIARCDDCDILRNGFPFGLRRGYGRGSSLRNE